MPRLGLIIGALFLGAVSAHADPTAREIIDRVAAQDRILQQHRKAFDYDLIITQEKLDDQQRVTSTDRDILVVHGDKKPSYGTRDDSPQEETKKAAREEPFELLRIVDHYTFTLEGHETIGLVPCYRIAFTPKPGMPYANREEKVLNAVAGRLWVSEQDYSLIRNEGALQHPVSVAWIFASLREMDFRFDTQMLPNGDYGPLREQYRYLVHIPFMTLHQRVIREMAHFRPTAATP